MSADNVFFGFAILVVVSMVGSLGFAIWDVEMNKPKTTTQHNVTTMAFPYDVTCVQKGNRSFICERAE